MVKVMLLQISNLKALDFSSLTLDSTISELNLDHFQVEISTLGQEIGKIFQNNPSLPGIILTENHQFFGMISRRSFLERMSQPYSVELFFPRPIKSLYEFVNTQILILSGNTSIVKASQQALQRSEKTINEPIVVVLEEQKYCLLDIYQLLVAQSKIQELTLELLDEKNYYQRLQNEKMATLGRMLMGIAHELRNPVNYINGNLDFVANYHQSIAELINLYQTEINAKSQTITDFEEEIELDYILEDFAQLVTSLKQGSQKLIAIIASLNNFATIDDRKRLVKISECIDSVLLISNSLIKNKIEIVKNYGEIPEILAYTGQLTQAFMSILINAIDSLLQKRERQSEFPNWQPQLTISLEKIEDYLHNSWIAIKIHDNGLGMSWDTQQQILDNCFTNKPTKKMTGLGLAISYQIITEKHQGKISFNSTMNQEAEFEILLPII
jgi:signal transduction histidine kinase